MSEMTREENAREIGETERDWCGEFDEDHTEEQMRACRKELE